LNEWKIEWLKTPPNTLKDFYWAAQDIHKPVISYLNAWAAHEAVPEQLRWLTKMGQIPQDEVPPMPHPFLFLFGPNNTGKTEFIGRGIARFFVLNLGYRTFQYIHWPTYVAAHLNKEPIEVDWGARFLILDDFDGWRPIPKSGDTWVLNHLMPLRNRVWPAICISNRKPGNLLTYFSTSVSGDNDDDTIQAATTVLVGLARKSFYNGGVLFKDAVHYNKISLTKNNAELQRLAREQDFYALGFPREVNGKEARY
jgi:hypothetical protein